MNIRHPFATIWVVKSTYERKNASVAEIQQWALKLLQRNMTYKLILTTIHNRAQPDIQMDDQMEVPWAVVFVGFLWERHCRRVA